MEEEKISSVSKDYSSEISEIIRSNLPADEIREKLEQYHENDIASALEFLSKEERQKLYRILGNEKVSEIFAYLDDVEDYIGELSNEKAADIIEEMDVDDAIDVLDELEDDKKEKLIALLDDEAKKDIVMVQSFTEEQIGSKMTTNYICIKEKSSVKEAMKSLIEQAADNDNVSTIYVVDDEGKYAGAIELHELIIARATTELEDIIIKSYPYVYGDEEIENCINEIKDYDEDSIPVLDCQNKLIGVITSSDILEVVHEQADEDYVKFAAVTDVEDLNEPLIKSLRKRTPWIFILMCLGMLVSSVTGLFEGTIKELAYIVCFQSLILDMSGNGGTQTLAITLRVLDREDLSTKEKFKFLFKEMRVGFFNGLIMGIICFIFMGLFVKFRNGFTYHHSFVVSGCISIACLVSMTVASIMGCLIPMIIKKLKKDPAVASGPMITTVVDLVSVITYYGMASLILIKMFHY